LPFFEKCGDAREAYVSLLIVDSGKWARGIRDGIADRYADAFSAEIECEESTG
jgi:hypothetical protein